MVTLVAALLGLIFTAGMLAVDGANGVWIHHLIRAPAATAQRTSRGLTCAIALLSLGLALFGLARLASAYLDGWYGSHSLVIGTGCTLVLLVVWGLERLRRSASNA